jgi:hypothetical protein
MLYSIYLTFLQEYGVKPFFDALVNFPNKILRRFDFISTESPSQSPPVCPLSIYINSAYLIIYHSVLILIEQKDEL